MSSPPHDRPPGADASAQGLVVSAEDASAWLDGELADEELAAFEAELEVNAALRTEADELREVADWLASEGPTEAPMGFANRVLERIDEEYPAPAPWWAWLRRPFGLPVEGLVVGLSAAVVLVLVLPKTTSTPDGPTEHAARQAPPAPVSEERTYEAYEQADGVADEEDAAQTVAREDTTRAAVPPQATSRKAKPTLQREMPPATTSKPLTGTGTAGTGDLGTTESVKTLPTDAEHVPSPADVDTPTRKTTSAERARLDAHTLPFELSSGDPKMLARVLKLAARFGGAMDANGREIGDPTMRRDAQDVFVRVPQDRLLDFENQLRALGYGLEVPGNTKLLAGSDIVVQLRLIRPTAGAASEAL